MLTIARTLEGNPEILLLDKPSEGLAPIIVSGLGEFIAVIKKEGMTVRNPMGPEITERMNTIRKERIDELR